MESRASDRAQAAGRRRCCAFPWQFLSIDLTGEVAPCGYWSFVGERALGNTNEQPIAAIWNNAAFRDLRRRHAAGDLAGHPCARCPAPRMMGAYPAFEWGDSFRHDAGACHIGQIPDSFWQQHGPAAAAIEVLEDGVPLPHGNCLHDEIRRRGGGRYSVWRGCVYLSTVDGSDPAANGRRYELRRGDDRVALDRVDLSHASGRNLVRAHEEYQRGAEVMTASPGKITFIESSDCNIDCPSCSQNEVRRTGIRHLPATTPQVMDLLPTLYELTWHGGEPYMMPQFRRFVGEFDPATHPNLSFAFMSNGTMITAAEATKLQRFPRLNVTVSMDSFVPTTYERLRAGARFDRVLANVRRLQAAQDWPRRRVTIAMIVGKSGMPEIGHNVRFALANDLRLMVNPITQYPVAEQLNVFEDFAAQTRGWDAALDDAEAALREAAASDRRSLHFLDPTGAIAELRRIHRQQAVDHADCVVFRFDVVDAHGSLSRMRRPALLLQPEAGGLYETLAYAEVRPRGGRHEVRVPRSRLGRALRWALLPDLFDVGARLAPRSAAARGAGGAVTIDVPPYDAPPLRRNVDHADLAAPHWTAVDGRGPDEHLRRARAASGPCGGFETVGWRERVARAAAAWSAFLPNYFRPFASRRPAGGD
ncbi:MAG: SPASM domain-containing protein [Planctomycetes bacterium]|nr:SPASM domain-containing protein [Planctomycetota bacterium]